MEIIIYILLVVLVLLSLPSTITLCPYYKHYSKVYKSLKYRKFYKAGNIILSHKLGDTDDGFVWFLGDNSFCLQDGVYLHSAFFTYTDLYSLYWLLKYRRWMRKNINLNTIEDY